MTDRPAEIAIHASGVEAMCALAAMIANPPRLEDPQALRLFVALECFTVQLAALLPLPRASRNDGTCGCAPPPWRIKPPA